MDVAVGRALNHDVDADLDRFISRRHEDRVRKEERDRAEEMAWKASVRAYNAARDEERREAWSSYHRAQAERHKAVLASLIEHHEQEAEKLGGDAA